MRTLSIINKEYWRLVLIVTAFGFCSPINADIIVRLKLDTTKWAPVAYLSLIPDFSQTNTIAFDNIIERSEITENGVFKFQTKLLPEEPHLYRIHISKIGDPPASLIIGGASHNHFFLFAKKDIEIQVRTESVNSLFQDLSMQGYYLNISLLETKKMKSPLDTFDLYGSVNIDFAQNFVYNQLRNYADTSSSPLIALYAIYQSNYKTNYVIQPDYYTNFLDKWEDEESLYFEVFRKELAIESKSNRTQHGALIITIFIISIMLALYFLRTRKKDKNDFTKLTVQERRIYSLMKEGKTNKEMADEYNVSVSTVKSHVNNIYSKLGVNSRKEILDHNNY